MPRRSWLERLNPTHWLKAIGRAIEDVFAPEHRERPARRGTRPPAREERPTRQARRERDPWRQDWLAAHGGRRGGYLGHRDIARDMALSYNVPVDEQREFWQDYNRWLVNSGRYRFNDIHNPFWQKWGIHPDTFDWDEWRKYMDTPRGKGTR